MNTLSPPQSPPSSGMPPAFSGLFQYNALPAHSGLHGAHLSLPIFLAPPIICQHMYTLLTYTALDIPFSQGRPNATPSQAALACHDMRDTCAEVLKWMEPMYGTPGSTGLRCACKEPRIWHIIGTEEEVCREHLGYSRQEGAM